MKKFLAMMLLLGLCAGVGIYLYSATVLDDEEYAQGGASGGDDEPESWGDDNDLNE